MYYRPGSSNKPVLVLLPGAISSAEQGAVDLVVLAVPQLIGYACFPPAPEVVEMDDTACTGVKPWRPLWGQPHVIVPVYLHAMQVTHSA